MVALACRQKAQEGVFSNATDFMLKEGTIAMVQLLFSHMEFIAIIVIPFAIFIADLILRLGFEIDLVDAGADMSLWAVSSFAAIFIEHLKIRPRIPFEIFVAEFAFLTLFGIIWLLCLIFTAKEKKTPKVHSIWKWKYIAWGLGLISIILASRLSWELIELIS